MSDARVVVFDANVLYPAFLRDFLLRLARTGAFRARWTERIHDEWTRSLIQKYPDFTEARARAVRKAINDAVPDSVISGFEHLIPAFELPDPDDRHVLAAAVHARAGVVVTFNTRDFPPAVLEPLGIRALTPDAFVTEVYEDDPASIELAAWEQRTSFIRRPESPAEYIEHLRRAGLPTLADRFKADGVQL